MQLVRVIRSCPRDCCVDVLFEPECHYCGHVGDHFKWIAHTGTWSVCNSSVAFHDGCLRYYCSSMCRMDAEETRIAELMPHVELLHEIKMKRRDRLEGVPRRPLTLLSPVDYE
jgi:hypothetical protein